MYNYSSSLPPLPLPLLYTVVPLHFIIECLHANLGIGSPPQAPPGFPSLQDPRKTSNFLVSESCTEPDSVQTSYYIPSKLLHVYQVCTIAAVREIFNISDFPRLIWYIGMD